MGLVTGCASASPPSTARGAAPTQDLAPAAAAAAAAKKIVVVAVGDIACRPGAQVTKTACRHARTARLTRSLEPDAVLALGDLQYESGTLPDFRGSYDKTWGRLLDKTYPVPGNHEYRTPGARGYYAYFDDRQPGKPGYYAFNLGKWRVYALNSNCGDIACGAEYRWLKRDLAAKPRACSIFMMHHPRFSSGIEHGSDRDMARFFSIAVDNDVEMVLAGHDHDYERFRRMRASGAVDRSGVLSFVSGAGGKSAYDFGKVEEGSAYRLSGRFGVLRLALRQDRFNFSFRDIDGSVEDRGRRSCR